MIKFNQQRKKMQQRNLLSLFKSSAESDIKNNFLRCLQYGIPIVKLIQKITWFGLSQVYCNMV